MICETHIFILYRNLSISKIAGHFCFPQMVSSSLFLYALRRRKIISFTAADSFSIDSASTFVPVKTLFHTLPLAIAYLLYMLASMASVRGVNVPMYTTLRRTTVAFTMVIEYMLTGQRYTRSIIGR
jgi:solute carrier family 35 protein